MFILVPLERSWALWKRRKSVYFAGNGTRHRPACRVASTPTELSPFPPIKFISGIMPGGLARQEHKRASLVCRTADSYFCSFSVILAVRWPPRPVVSLYLAGIQEAHYF